MSPILLTLVALQMSANFDDTVKMYEENTYVYTGGEYKEEPFKWRLLKPETIEPNKKYPVILFLHGAGERGDDNKNQLKYFGEAITKPENRQKYPCFVIAPQCRKDKKWADVNWAKKESEGMPKEASDQAKVARAILDEVVRKYPVDEKKLYLTGLSMGGYGSWDIACRYPEKFACVVPICGGGDDSQAAKLIKLPIFCFHGDADPAVPVGRSRSMIEAIKKAGGEPKYTEYPGVGHNSWDRAYNDADGALPWMFQQAKK